VDAIVVGRRLREARGNRSTSDVAAAVNVSKSAIEMYECGARMPRDDVKEKMALFFGTTVGALFFGE
jgi:transcriptional regulator with XRE-family HTH domain